MYRVIIADDEPLIREGLARRCEWAKLGFEVVASLEDGKDVLEYLKRCGADVVLADIRMYEVTGLEVAREISARYPLIRVMLISGYREFEYAREAISYGVYEYLIKPIDYGEMFSVFQKLRSELDRERRELVSLKGVSEGDYMQLLGMVRSIMNSVMDAGEEAWISYARMAPMLGDATDEVREFVVRRLLGQLYDSLMKRDARLAQRLQSEMEEISRAAPDKCAEALVAILKELNDQIVGKKLRGPDDSIAKACKYISNHLSEDFSCADVAEFVHLSPRHFIRRFQSERGETFSEYLISVRMTSAMRLLAEGGYSTDEICRAVGYRDEKYFRQLFKKYAGCSPREYVARLERGPGA